MSSNLKDTKLKRKSRSVIQRHDEDHQKTNYMSMNLYTAKE